jgi:hypothetical protein
VRPFGGELTREAASVLQAVVVDQGLRQSREEHKDVFALDLGCFEGLQKRRQGLLVLPQQKVKLAFDQRSKSRIGRVRADDEGKAL